MQSIALHDTVRVTTIHGEKKPRGIVLSCSLPFLPTDERNLAYRAAELFYKETGALLETCEIHIEKRIPVAAGLAGGSTDAAAVLRALNALHTAGLTDDELCEMGLKLGADVPFCLRGGTMLAQGIGEELSLLPICRTAGSCCASRRLRCRPRRSIRKSTAWISSSIRTTRV